MLDNSLAIRYANALYNAVCKNGTLSTAQQELDTICALLLGRPDVKRILFHPAIPAAEKKTFCNELVGNVISPLLSTFVNILIDSKRINYLGLVVELFKKRVSSENKRIVALVRSAKPIPGDLVSGLEKALVRYTGSAVDLTFQTSPELIGGLSILIGDKLLDGSIAHKLQKMTESLVS